MHNLYCKVYAIENEFFGKTVTCTGLLTGTDICNAVERYCQEKGKPDEMLLAGNVLKEFEDVFLCGMTLKEMKRRLGIKIKINRTGGYGFVEALRSEK